MAMKWFRFPFAVSGDKTTVPDGTQGDGSVSYEQGYPLDYSRNPATDPAAKRIERFKMNQIFNDVTNYLRSLSLLGTPDFVTAAENGGTPVSYAIGAQVMFDPGTGTKLRYESVIASNTTDPSNTSNWRQVTTYQGKLIGIQRFSTPGSFTYTPAPGTTSVVVELVGGGGAGGGGAACGAGQYSIGAGGGAGGYGRSRYISGFAGVTIVVGGGGARVAGTTGGNGGSSSFGALMSASGGAGGGTLPPTTVTPNLTVGGGGGAGISANLFNSNGGAGESAQSAASSIFSGAGGSSVFGGGGARVVTANNDGVNAPSQGCGGSGGNTGPGGAARLGGGGAAGMVIVYEYA